MNDTELTEALDEVGFYRRLNFKANPFQYTNADEEDELEEYFVPPPYFQSVWGDPKQASSCVVFAPRGGGKSAQRKMIESRSRGTKVLTLQYSRFEFAQGQSLDDIDLNYHIRNIARICILGFLMQIHQEGLGAISFSSTEREHIKALSKFYLYDMNSEEIVNAVNSVTGLLGRTKEYVENNLYAINALIDGLLSKAGLPAVGSGAGGHPGQIERPSKQHLEIIISLIKSLGFDSVYILIDKIDETSLTGNDANASFRLIGPLLRDLELLQIRDLAFKFFLWNEIYPFYKQHGRPDRIPLHHLKWRADELKTMLRLRLQVYSTNGPRDISALLKPGMEAGSKNAVDSLLLTFSHGSPRDMIRICAQMVVEQLRLNPHMGYIGVSAVTEGFNRFCVDRAKEVVPESTLRDLQKLHRLDFTVASVASVAKIKANGARAKIKTWLNTGVVKYINDIRLNEGKKPVHHYAVLDSRVAKSIFPELSFVEFLQTKVRVCSKCRADMFRDWDVSSNHICQACKALFG